MISVSEAVAICKEEKEVRGDTYFGNLFGDIADLLQHQAAQVEQALRLAQIIVNSSPSRTIKGEIESLAFDLENKIRLSTQPPTCFKKISGEDKHNLTSLELPYCNRPNISQSSSTIKGGK